MQEPVSLFAMADGIVSLGHLQVQDGNTRSVTTFTAGPHFPSSDIWLSSRCQIVKILTRPRKKLGETRR